MSDTATDAPIFALVDDHIHSAELFGRTLRDTEDLAQVRWLGNAERAFDALVPLLRNIGVDTPDMIVVDPKSDSGANEDFVARLAPHARKAGVPLAAVVAGLNTDKHNRLLQAGASAVFERHHEVEAYRREIARICSFWVRETATWPIRA